MTKKRQRDTAKKRKINSPEGDWLNDLVKQTTSADPIIATSKLDRIQKRQAKKKRRDQRLSEKITIQSRAQGLATVNRTDAFENKVSSSDWTRKLLTRLATEIQAVVDSHSSESTQRSRLYQGEAMSNFKKRQWETSTIQPRRNDYGGIGLARQSLFLEMEDPSFTAKLDDEFQEHVPGFFGKQRTKAMKKQLNSQMLWKQMSAKKDMKIGGKRLGDLKADEQVEAMIKAGMI
jgi:hypothetical protein